MVVNCRMLLSSRLQEVMSSFLVKRRQDEAIKGQIRVDHAKPNFFRRVNGRKVALI